jgi:hypothetical protein
LSPFPPLPPLPPPLPVLHHHLRAELKGKPVYYVRLHYQHQSYSYFTFLNLNSNFLEPVFHPFYHLGYLGHLSDHSTRVSRLIYTAIPSFCLTKTLYRIFFTIKHYALLYGFFTAYITFPSGFNIFLSTFCRYRFFHYHLNIFVLPLRITHYFMTI